LVEGINIETNEVADESELNGKENEPTNQDDKYHSSDSILPSLKKRPLKSASEPANKTEKTSKKLGSKLSHLAFKYAESKLDVNFDVDKTEMRNEIGYHNFDGAYFPPISNGVLTGDIFFLEIKVFSSMRIESFLKTIDLINESWRHFKNFRVYLVYVFTEKNSSAVNSFRKEIATIKNKSHFPLEIDVITADELMFRFGEISNVNL